MHYDETVQASSNTQPAQLTTNDVERWTSTAYRIRFGQVEFVQTPPDQEGAFHISAWGISKSLRDLLSDYSNQQIHDATAHLTLQQNSIVAEILEQVSFSSRLEGGMIPSLEELFIAIHAEIYLPRGLRMLVTCVTNIVSHGEDAGLDKFVAILDPGEAQMYVQERKGNSTPSSDKMFH